MSYAPNETHAQIYSEETFLQGALLASVGYGVVLTLYVFCMHLLVTGMNATNRRTNACFIVYVTVMFVLGTLFQASNSQFTQLAYVEDRDFPGGPAVYEEAMFYIPVDTMGNVAYVLSNWLADGLLMWRCMVICRASFIPIWIIMALPCLLYAGSLAMGVCYLVQVSTPNSSAWVTTSVNFTLPYASLSFGLNIIITLVIVVRLLVSRRQLRRILGRGHGTHYTSIMAMLVESAILYAAFSIFFLAPWAAGNALANICFQASGQVQIIAPFMIIARVALGKAWGADTSTKLFTAGTGAAARSRSGNAVRMVAYPRMKFASNPAGTGASGDSPTLNGSGLLPKPELEAEGEYAVAINKTVDAEFSAV